MKGIIYITSIYIIYSIDAHDGDDDNWHDVSIINGEQYILSDDIAFDLASRNLAAPLENWRGRGGQFGGHAKLLHFLKPAQVES